MQKYRPYVILGSVLLGLSFLLIIFGIVKYITVLYDVLADTAMADIAISSLMMIFGGIFFDGGLFLVIFFSIKGNKLDKREREKALNSEQNK